MNDREYRSSRGELSRARDRGVALVLSLVVAAAIGASSTAAGANPHSGHRVVHHRKHHRVAHHAHHAAGIPQHNRGDHDPDNNGARSDGDGNV